MEISRLVIEPLMDQWSVTGDRSNRQWTVTTSPEASQLMVISGPVVSCRRPNGRRPDHRWTVGISPVADWLMVGPQAEPVGSRQRRGGPLVDRWLDEKRETFYNEKTIPLLVECFFYAIIPILWQFYILNKYPNNQYGIILRKY